MTVERYFGKTYWTSAFGKSMTAMKNRPQGWQGAVNPSEDEVKSA